MSEGNDCQPEEVKQIITRFSVCFVGDWSNLVTKIWTSKILICMFFRFLSIYIT